MYYIRKKYHFNLHNQMPIDEQVIKKDNSKIDRLLRKAPTCFHPLP